jgi:hypothetical protein
MTMPDVIFAAIGHSAGRAGSAAWIGVVAATVVLLVAVCGVWCYALWVASRWESGGEDSDHGGGGGGGDEGPSPPSRSPETDPAWWPEFEREFAAYIEATSAKSTR